MHGGGRITGKVICRLIVSDEKPKVHRGLGVVG